GPRSCGRDTEGLGGEREVARGFGEGARRGAERGEGESQAGGCAGQKGGHDDGAFGASARVGRRDRNPAWVYEDLCADRPHRVCARGETGRGGGTGIAHRGGGRGSSVGAAGRGGKLYRFDQF